MFRAFIVDDDAYTRKGLREHFDWKGHNIELAGEAGDGESALRAIKELAVDIVVTDVKMPRMDGIELARALHEYDKGVRIVFISGYGDLEYLKSAFKVDGVDYILKSIDLDEFGKTIDKVVGMLESEKLREETIAQMEVRLTESMPLLRDKFLMMLIRDEIGLPYAEERIKFLNLNLPPDGLYCVYILGVRNYLSKFSVMSEKDKQLTSFKAISISEEVVNELCAGYVFESRQDEFAVLLSLKDDYETELLRIADGIISRLQNELKLSVVIGISRAERGVENLKSLYAGARNAIKSAMLDAGKRIAIDRFGGNSEGSRRIYLKDQQKLADSLLAGNNEGAERALNHIFKETAKYEKGLARNCLFYIVASLMQSMSELQNSSESVLPDAKSVCERFFSLEKVEDMQSYLLSLCLDCCDSLNSMNKSQPKGIIRQAKKIIEEKYAENLSVNDIAKEVFLTNTYLCFLFKQETGMTINEYLIDVRIRAAKAMLDNANNKIYDVAFAVGYKSVSYFTRLFAKTTGITPSEYRGKVSFRKE